MRLKAAKTSLGFFEIFSLIILVTIVATALTFTQKDKIFRQSAPPIESGPSPQELAMANPTPSPTPTATSSPNETPKPSVTPSASPKTSLTPASSPQVEGQVLADNTPPSAGFKRQSVKTDLGTFTVSIIAANLESTRVVVDTASDSTCGNDCPALSLKDYVARNGAFAGINGSYFCPKDYASCAAKTNSFDTLLMNKDKVYFNSDNNVYSTVPAVIFGPGWIRFVKQSLEWGRDTGVDGVLANYPLLTFNNAIDFSESSDPKLNNKGGRSFIGATGDTIYMGVVHSATVLQAAHALHALGIHNSLNLDDGRSTALWSGGYRAGPGRNIPNAILFAAR